MERDDNILLDISKWNMFIKLFVTVVGSCDGTCTVKDSTTAEATCRLTYGAVTHLCSCPPGFHLTEANPDECVGMCVSLLSIGYRPITSIVSTHIPDRKSTRLNSSHVKRSRMPSSA